MLSLGEPFCFEVSTADPGDCRSGESERVMPERARYYNRWPSGEKANFRQNRPRFVFGGCPTSRRLLNVKGRRESAARRHALRAASSRNVRLESFCEKKCLR